MPIKSGQVDQKRMLEVKIASSQSVSFIATVHLPAFGVDIEANRALNREEYKFGSIGCRSGAVSVRR